MSDYYEILGVNPDATPDEIQERFRFLAQGFHPDKFSSPKQKELAEEEFKKINTAYQTLSNPRERAEYDLKRRSTVNYSRANIYVSRMANELARYKAQEEQRIRAEEAARQRAKEEKRKKVEEAARQRSENEQRKKAKEELKLRQKELDNLIKGRNKDYRGFNFKGLQLRYVYLFWTNLSGVDLSGLDLYGANLSSADLSGANLSGANLSMTHLKESDLRKANLKNADLRRADLRKANLYEANLTKANLSGANLTNACLEYARLDTVDLTEADLTDANLVGVYFGKASMAGANLSGAYLVSAILNETETLLSSVNLRGTIYDVKTKWPKEFNPDTAGAVLKKEKPAKVEDEKIKKKPLFPYSLYCNNTLVDTGSFSDLSNFAIWSSKKNEIWKIRHFGITIWTIKG